MGDSPAPAVRITGEEGFAGIMPCEDAGGEPWYCIRRFDFGFILGALLGGIVLAGLLGYRCGGSLADDRWQARWTRLGEFSQTFDTDCWTDADGVEHHVSRGYSAHDYALILQYASKFEYVTLTNAYRQVDGPGK